VVGTLVACRAEPPIGSTAPDASHRGDSAASSESLRLPILSPAYGGHPDFPDALAPGDPVPDTAAAPLRWDTADLGVLALADLRGAGPVVLVSVGGAEHALLTEWAGQLAHALPEFEARGANLVFVRPLDPAGALRWASELHIQAAVVGDSEGTLHAAMGLVSDDPDDPAESAESAGIGFAVWIVDSSGLLRYRKLDGRRPELDELLTVLDGQAETRRCCPGTCVGAPCESTQ